MGQSFDLSNEVKNEIKEKIKQMLIFHKQMHVPQKDLEK
jgi:hypothetical protein